MHVRRSASAVEITAPAKLNLFLEVLARRSDGFHEIESLMVPISRFDTLRAVATQDDALTLLADDSPLRLAPSTPFDPSLTSATCEQLPGGEDNLVIRAVRRLRERSGVTQGIRIQLTKRIPLAAGLAGGSSDAAAALVAANEVWRLGWSYDQLREIAAELGSDVPFFLGHGPAICRGRGEIIEPLSALGALHFVVAKPAVGLSTADVYRACRPAEQPRGVGELVAALRRGCLAAAGRALHNTLENAAETLSPWISRLREEFTRLSVLGRQMSGSGTSYFGLCQNALHARRVAARLRCRGLGQVWAVASCP